MRIKIQNYEILNFENYSLIGSEKGISRINSKKLITALEELKPICEKTIDLETLESILAKYDLEKPISEQLHHHLKIQYDVPPNYFDSVYIFHDWKERKQHTINLLDSEIPLPLTHLPLHLNALNSVTHERSLIILLPGSHNTSELKHIYFEASNTLPKSFIICGYFSPATFTVTQPYSADLGNPCLFCSLSRAIHFETQADGACAWSAMLNFCTSNSADFQNPKLSMLQHSMVVGLISKKINTILSSTNHKLFQDNILTNSTVDLNNGRVAEEILPHWHMCDCLKANHENHTA